MYHALDIGISVDEFWEMTPRGILLLLDEMMRANKVRGQQSSSAAAAPQVVKLNYIPRP